MKSTVIIGAGLAGLSASYHFGHDCCVVLERTHRPFGHIGSVQRHNFTWDEGPHVSFTKNNYVRELFASSLEGEYREFDVKVSNYYRGSWIDHPAQVSLHQVPEPLRTKCLESFLKSRQENSEIGRPPVNYQQWLEKAFGPVFANTFPSAYTRKYWTREPRDLAVSWVGERILYPDIEDVLTGAQRPLGRNANYITTVRYPKNGGFQQFARGLASGADLRFGVEPVRIDLVERRIWLSDGSEMSYKRLVSTIPLPVFLKLLPERPACVEEAQRQLLCSELRLVNVTAGHASRRPETWFYIYDEDKLSTRVNLTEHLSPFNAPEGATGVQVEVYASRHRPFHLSKDEMAKQVQRELTEIGVIDSSCVLGCTLVEVPWANVIFDHETRPSLECIWSWLEQFGLERESGDTTPLTNWSQVPDRVGSLAFAGRYAQWKYYWTDDCVLRGRVLALAGA
jgi:protoporphyrinogen oxidase